MGRASRPPPLERLRAAGRGRPEGGRVSAGVSGPGLATGRTGAQPHGASGLGVPGATSRPSPSSSSAEIQLVRLPWVRISSRAIRMAFSRSSSGGQLQATIAWKVAANWPVSSSRALFLLLRSSSHQRPQLGQRFWIIRQRGL